MTITTTAIAFTISSLGLAFCGFWFFKAFQSIGGMRSGRPIGILMSVLFLGTAFQHGMLAASSWFFPKNPEAYYGALVFNHFIVGMVSVLAVYLAFYILWPKFSPWPAVAAAFVFTILSTAFTIIDHPLPFIDENNAINWGLTRRVELSVYLLLLLHIGSIFLIFTKNFFTAATRSVKIIFSFIALAALVGLVNVSVRFSGLFGAGKDSLPHIFDRILVIVGIIFIIGFLIIPIYWWWILKRSEKKLKTQSKN